MNQAELDAELLGVLEEIDNISRTGEPAPDAAPEAALEPAPGEEPAPPGDEALLGPSPETIRTVSEDLVEMGYLSVPTDRVTSEFKAALQSFVDERMPGMFDLSDPDQLLEVISAAERGDFGTASAGPDAAVTGPAEGTLPPGGPAPIGG